MHIVDRGVQECLEVLGGFVVARCSEVIRDVGESLLTLTVVEFKYLYLGGPWLARYSCYSVISER